MENFILAIETSCDETSASINLNGKVLNNIVASQPIHEQYGGVVPELASRAHLKNIIPIVHEALAQAHVPYEKIKAVAYTKGPGLMGSLLVGSSFAKSLSLAWGVPLIGVNHLEAHVSAHFIHEPHPTFPFLCLLVSGGHTELVLVHDYYTMKSIGKTQDDAVGEAFDKTAKMLGISYPGGPQLDKLAQRGNPDAFTFATSKVPQFDFSFSGVKTSVLYFLQKQSSDFIEKNLPDLCASIQKTLVSMLMQKLLAAANQHQLKTIALAGGVAANSFLRRSVLALQEKEGWKVFIPDFQYCTDNAAMIGVAAYYKYLKHDFETASSSPDPSMSIVKA